MNNHTPTPWAFCENADTDNTETNFVSLYGVGEVRENITNLLKWYEPEKAIANAAHIVRCVNAHDALVEALKLAQAEIATLMPRLTYEVTQNMREVQKRISVALKSL